MALTLNNFTGFETGGLEEASATSGTPTVPTGSARSGARGLLLDAAGEEYDLPWATTGASNAGNDYIFGFAVRFGSTSEDATGFCSIQASGTPIALAVGASAKIELRNSLGTVVITSTNAVGTSGFHYVEVYFQNLNSGNAELFIDGVSEGTASAQDFLTAALNSSHSLQFQYDGTNDVEIDDVYILSGATAASDRLGPSQVFGYQSGESTTRVGTPTTGTFTETGDTPGVEESDANALSALGTSALTLTCDLDDASNARGQEGGPSTGAADVSGTIQGAKWVFNLNRSNGSGTSLRYLYGNTGDGETSSADQEANLTVTYAIFEVLSEAAGQVPTSSEDFSLGISAGTDDTGGRRIRCADAWAMLLHTPSSAPSGNGSLEAQAATVSGSGVSLSDGNGSLDPLSAEVSGSGLAAHLGSGTLQAQAAQVAGSGDVQDAATTGNGSIDAQAATVAGSGVSKSLGNGSLDAQLSSVAGSGISKSSGNGSLDGQAVQTDGSGDSKSLGNGALSVQDSQVDGSGAVRNTGNGALQAQDSQVDGSGQVKSLGSGALAAQSSQVSGSGVSKSSGNGKLGEVVVDENWPSAGSNFFLFGATGGNEQAAINFTAKLTTTTTTVRFFLSTVGGTPSDDVIVDIAADSAGAPGSVLDTVTLANAGFTGAGVYELPLVASLTASTSYWLVFRRSGGPQASPWWSFKWQQAAGDPDPDAGTYWFNGSVWTEDTAGDGYFFIGGLQQATVAGSGEVKYTGDGSLDAQSAQISGSGVSSSSGNGALSAQAAQVAGSGASPFVGNGSLDAQSSQISGSGDSKSLGNGALQAQDSEVAGSGVIEAVTGNGDLQAQAPEASGSGVSSSSGNGALAAQAVQIAGSGTSASVGNGSLDAQSATVDGSGAIAAVTGNGDLQAQAAQIDGSGVSSSTGADILVAQNSTVSGSGVSSSSGNGVLSAQSAQVDGSGTPIALGNGSLLVQQAQVDGSGAVRTLGNGNLSAQDGTVDGSGVSSSAGNGALQAQDSQVDGSGDAGLSIINGNGSLLAQIATVTASGTSSSTGNGALQAQDAEMFGTDGIFVAAQSDFQGFRYGRKPQVKSAKLTFN